MTTKVTRNSKKNRYNFFPFPMCVCLSISLVSYTDALYLISIGRRLSTNSFVGPCSEIDHTVWLKEKDIHDTFYIINTWIMSAN